MRKNVLKMEMIYKEIRELEEILNVKDRGEKVIEDMKEREEEERKKIE